MSSIGPGVPDPNLNPVPSEIQEKDQGVKEKKESSERVENAAINALNQLPKEEIPTKINFKPSKFISEQESSSAEKGIESQVSKITGKEANEIEKPPTPLKSIIPPKEGLEKARSGKLSPKIQDPFITFKTQIDNYTTIRDTLKNLKESTEAPAGTDKKILAAETQLAQAINKLKPLLSNFMTNPEQFGEIIKKDPEKALDFIEILDHDSGTKLLERLLEVMSPKVGVAFKKEILQETLGSLFNAHISRETKRAKDNIVFLRTSTPLIVASNKFQEKLFELAVGEKSVKKNLEKNVINKKIATGTDVINYVVNDEVAKTATSNVYKDLNEVLKDAKKQFNIPPALISFYQNFKAEVTNKWGATIGAEITSGAFVLNILNHQIRNAIPDSPNRVVLTKLVQAIGNNTIPAGERYAGISPEYFAEQQTYMREIMDSLSTPYGKT